ncbi:MAG: FtsH-binding integral membrane protein, partial [Candidatus Omnitrophota bacterium]
DWIITYGLIAVFLGLIAYDTQRLKAMMAQGFDSKESEGKMALMGALRLYLDFINLFILLLRIFGVRR